MTCTVARAPSIVSFIRSVSILFILYMICHRRPALMDIYPPCQPVNVSFLLLLLFLQNLTNKFFFFFFFKVKVNDLLKFRKLHFSTSTSSAILAWRSQLMGDYDSIGPTLQLFGARFLNFSPSWRSRDFEVSSRNVDITRMRCVLSPRWSRLEACDCDCR